MIEGVVSRHLDPMVGIVLVGVGCQEVTVEVVVDTGFNGALSLPALTISALGFSDSGVESMTLADASDVQVNTYRGIVLWKGHPRIIDVVSSESSPLLGTELLLHNRLTVDMKPGGRVLIEPLP